MFCVDVLVDVIVVLIFLSGVIELKKEKSERLNKEWQEIQTERFLNKISRKGECTGTEYEEYMRAMTRAGQILLIRMQEYKEETDLQNNRYYYLVTWDEIWNKMQAGGSYIFENDSLVMIEIRHYSSGKETVQREYVLINGRN